MFKKMAMAGAFAVLASVVGAGPVLAQDYPARPVELVVPWGPGGGADQLARLVGKMLESELGVGIPVVNVPGGTGATGMAKLLASPADGYSMAIYIADSHALLAGTGARWSMDDIVPVAVMIQGPSFLFAPKNSPYATWADFEAAAKAKPDTLKVATLGFGSVDDFSLRTLAAKDVKVVQVPFAKPGERYISILGGHADLLYEQAGDVRQFLDSGEMRPLMIFGEERMEAFPDVPSSKELGYDVALPQFRAIVVRSGTPPEAIEKLSAALAKVAAADEYKAFLEEQYGVANSFLTGQEAADFMARQLEDMKRAAALQ